MSSEESRGTSRSGFLKQAAGATIVVAGAGAGAAAIAQQAAAGRGIIKQIPPSLEIDGVNVGALASATGGDIEYDVLADAVAAGENVPHKHLGQPKYEDFTIQIGSGMRKDMMQWITDSMDKGSVRKNGAIVTADFNFNEKARREFTDALITSVTVPKLDGSSKDAAYFTVTFAPTTVTDVPGSGQPVHAPKQKAWLPSNFRLIVDGVDTTEVSSIDSFTWKQLVQSDGSVVLDAGDLAVYFDRASLPSWEEWYDNFAVGGDATDERSGILEVVGAPGGGVLDIGFSNLGLFELIGTPSNRGIPTSSAATNRTAKAAMYCGRVKFTNASFNG